jgi:hypothetical protein
MVISDEADPFHLSAGSPSTGSNSVSGEGAIAPTPDVPALDPKRGASTVSSRSLREVSTLAHMF